MGDPPRDKSPFDTAAMAAILVHQGLLDEAAAVLERLPDDPRREGVRRCLIERASGAEESPCPVPSTGFDRVEIERRDRSIGVTWEVTERGLDLARRAAGRPGRIVLRLFSSAPGPRGVRHTTRDIEVESGPARLEVRGLPRPAVFVVAVGFLAAGGRFVPLAVSSPASTDPP